ncbi:hypothetical protein [Vibrio sp. D431a]|uniref:hypothetical protein n=1 Tax=Vibrio sp. D431a TaxID=2837388 RepID=UPI002555753B|nr:hypothetical protein [Vibrio sp. D431a]MDK9790131.1 hypothetical protein [Vibrio sp. D431a]
MRNSELVPPAQIILGSTTTLNFDSFNIEITGNPSGFVEISAVIDEIPFKDAVIAKISRQPKFRNQGRKGQCDLQLEFNSSVKVSNRPPRSELNEREKLEAMKCQGKALITVTEITQSLLANNEELKSFFVDYDKAQRLKKKSVDSTKETLTSKTMCPSELRAAVLSMKTDLASSCKSKARILTIGNKKDVTLELSKSLLGFITYSLDRKPYLQINALVDALLKLEPVGITQTPDQNSHTDEL